MTNPDASAEPRRHRDRFDVAFIDPGGRKGEVPVVPVPYLQGDPRGRVPVGLSGQGDRGLGISSEKSEARRPDGAPQRGDAAAVLYYEGDLDLALAPVSRRSSGPSSPLDPSHLYRTSTGQLNSAVHVMLDTTRSKIDCLRA